MLARCWHPASMHDDAFACMHDAVMLFAVPHSQRQRDKSSKREYCNVLLFLTSLKLKLTTSFFHHFLVKNKANSFMDSTFYLLLGTIENIKTFAYYLSCLYNRSYS